MNESNDQQLAASPPRTISGDSIAKAIAAAKMLDRVSIGNNNKRLGCYAGRKKAKIPSIKFSANNFVTQTRTDVFDEHYEIVQQLGEGAYGEVYICQHRETGVQRAVKIIEVTNDNDAAIVLSEFNILRDIDHPNLLKIYQLYEEEDLDEETDDIVQRFYIVSDLYEGGELYDEIEQWGYFEEEDAAILMNQVMSCLNYCHSRGVCHRDLKPENILLADSDMNLEDIKIIDFGLAETFDNYDEDKFTHRVGSSYYIAPQVMEGCYSAKCDIWSCGVICFILLCGEAPFDGDDDQEIMDAIYDGRFTFDENELWKHVSEEAKNFVEQLLTYEEEDRPTAEQALQHPWLANSRRVSSQGLLKKRDCKLAMSYLGNLEHFRAESKLKQAVCAFISSQLIMRHEKEVIDELFRAMDTNRDGKLSRDELKVGFHTFLNRQLTDAEVDDIFQRVNYSASGAIEYSEYCIASILLDETRLHATFNEFDKTKSGVLTADDLKHALHLCRDYDEHHDVDDYVVNKVMKQIDSNDDGHISFEEFKAAMMTAPKVPKPPQGYSFSAGFGRCISEGTTTGSAAGVRRCSIRRSTQLHLDDVKEASADVTEKEDKKKQPTTTKTNIEMGERLQSLRKAMKNNKPRKLKTARSNALPHAISTGYARRPSRVKSRGTPATVGR